MELPIITTSPAEPSGQEPDLTSKASSAPAPEAEAHRGRESRRSPLPHSIIRSAHNPSVESGTCRGRSRQRSTSLALSSSRNTSRGPQEESQTNKMLLRVMRPNRHRSQSPSRSRSPGSGKLITKRRRQRTRSRPRDHGSEESFASTKQAQHTPLRVEVTMEENLAGDKDG